MFAVIDANDSGTRSLLEELADVDDLAASVASASTDLVKDASALHKVVLSRMLGEGHVV